MIIKHTLLRLHHPYRSLRLILENTIKLFDLLPLAIRCSQRSRLHGIIPAHARLTSKHSSTMHHCRDHPRACGAHTSALSLLVDMSGSSPRMRGSPRSDRPICKCSGIIPAHAGLTFLPSFGLRRHRDHPRACGAHGLMTLNQIADMGSSPRMRGSPQFKVRAKLAAGIIPAHAGLTHHIFPSGRPDRDHPRACGAHSCHSPP